jgi:TatD DNase family protein
MIVDTHCHLDDERFMEDLDEVLSRAIADGVEKFIIPGADPDTLERAVEIAESREDVYFAVGVHPYDAHRYDREFLKRYITHEKCVAVGECGLDYYRLPDDKDESSRIVQMQKEVFIDQVRLADEMGKPLIIHIRDASADSKEILEEYAGERGGVLHCYNADRILLSLADRNFYFGIGGVLTFKNARRLVEAYPLIPRERLLIETDAPYLTPHPYRGKRNEPAYCVYIARKMAELSGMDFEELSSLCTENTERLFGV